MQTYVPQQMGDCTGCFYLCILWGERFTLFTNTGHIRSDGWTNELLACHPGRM